MTQVILDQENWVFSPQDRIFLGEGLFETLRVIDSLPCFPFLHWQRLKISAKRLEIVFRLSYEEWLDHLLKKIRQESLVAGGIKVVLSGGLAPRGLTSRGQKNQLRIQAFSFIPQTKPLGLLSSSWLRDKNNPIYGFKSTNYLEAIQAKRLAMQQGGDDILFFNNHLHATETTTSNLFLYYKDKVLTPPLCDGLLPGITRSRVLAVCQDQHISYGEVSITKKMIAEAEACFLTNSLQGIQPVQSFDEKFFMLPHPLVSLLKNALTAV